MGDQRDGEAAPTFFKGPEGASGRADPRDRENFKNFCVYYKEQLKSHLDDEGFAKMLAVLETPLPITFRMAGPRARDPAAAETLDQQLRSVLHESQVLRRLEWYPLRAAWQIDIDKKGLRAPEMKPFQEFLLRETSCGNISRMEAVSMMPAIILDPQPGDLVLDLCAAPGSKTGQLMETVVTSKKADGAVVANDPDLKRARMMIHRTKTLASPSLLVTAVPGQLFPIMQLRGKPVPFDRVLCDVPCSGDGTIRKSWTSLAKWQVNHGNSLHVLQIQLLKRCLQLVKVGGFVVYSTCTFNPIENEAVVAQALVESCGTVELAPSDIGPLTRREGLTTWVVPDLNKNGTFYETYDSIPESNTRFPRNRGCSKRGLVRSMFPPTGNDGNPIAQSLKQCVRIFPQDQNTGGFFICLLKKTGEVPWKDYEPPSMEEIQQSSEASAALVRKPDEGEAVERVRAVGTSDEHDLPADYIARITKVERQQHKLKGLVSYTPFTATDNGLEKWGSISSFYGISESFPHEQLLAHSDKMGIVSFVSSSVRRVIDASAELIENDQDAISNIVNAGLRMFQHNNSGYTECDYRLCLEALPRLLPYMTKRVISVERSVFTALLDTMEIGLGGIPGAEDVSCGSLALRMMDANQEPINGTAVVAWRGRATIRLWVDKEAAQSILARIMSQDA